MDRSEILQMIRNAAERYGIDPAIVFGVCMQESSLNPKATRYERNYKWLWKPSMVLRPKGIDTATETMDQKTSWGLMQVMGAVFREYGYADHIHDVLKFPEVQLDYGCRHLARRIAKWGRNPGILAYNSGTPRRNGNGEFVNAYYLEKVMRYSKGYQNA